MALKDNAVITASQGFLYINTVGAAAPTPIELDALDPDTFGAQKHVVKITGAPTSYTLKVGADETETAELAGDATAAQVQAAIEAVASVGAGNVEVSGVSATDTDGLTIYFTGELQGQTVALAEGTYVGGTTPDTAITTTAPNGWKNIGHTSRDDMPEFGFDGGDKKVRGSWQKKRLREVADGDPVADSVTITLEQFDLLSLELYFGADASGEDGVFGVSGDFEPVEYALLIVIVDGPTRVGFYAPKASFTRDDSIDMPVDDFTGFPVKATFLNLGARRLYDWISKKLFKKS